jgi:hypothetical protein
MFAEIDYERLNKFKNLGLNPCVIFDVGASNGNYKKLFGL